MEFMAPLTRTVIGLMIAAATPAVTWSQATQSPSQSLLQGLSLSAYTGYYSNGFSTSTSGAAPNGSALASEVQVGGSAGINWSRVLDRSNLGLTYNLDFTTYAEHSSLSALNHRLSFRFGRHLTPRLTYQFTASGTVATTDQLLFLGPGGIDTGDLLGGTGSLSSGLPNISGTQAVISPFLLAYGQRTLNTVAQTSLSYLVSSRTSLSVSASGVRTQEVGAQPLEGDAGSPIFPQTTTASLNFQISHSLSPRTEITVSVAGNRTFSRFDNAYYATTSIALERNISRRWFLGMHGGGGYIQGVGQTGSSPVGKQYLAGVRPGFHTQSHSFVLMWERNIGNSYGIGANYANTAGGGWNWHRPGRSWHLGVTFNDVSIQGPAYDIHGWQGGINFSKTLSEHLALLVSYGVLRYSTGGSSPNTITPNAIRLALSWRPALVTVH